MSANKPLGLTPAMGWNSWNTFTWDINEQLIRDVADLFVSEGYKDAGYEYIVIDDCWSLKERDENGNLVADPDKFPSGMRALADYNHAKGLKFGMYSCAGTHTCAGYPGSFEHEFQSLLYVLSDHLLLSILMIPTGTAAPTDVPAWENPSFYPVETLE